MVRMISVCGFIRRTGELPAFSAAGILHEPRKRHTRTPAPVEAVLDILARVAAPMTVAEVQAALEARRFYCTEADTRRLLNRLAKRKVTSAVSPRGMVYNLPRRSP
jgi:hypothetical protein